MDLIPSLLTEYTLENYLIKISPKTRIIYWTIIIMIIGGISVLPFIYIDVSVNARGFFQTDIEKQKLFVPFQGKVVKASLKSGQTVRKGDTLIIIDSETIRAQKKAIQKNILENNHAIADLEKLNKLHDTEINLRRSEFNTDRYYTEYNNMVNARLIQLQKYQRSKIQHERNIVLHNQEILPDSEFENSLFFYKSEEENLNQIITYHKTLWHADLMLRKTDGAALQADLEHCNEELRNRIVLSPVDGEVIQSADFQIGSVVGIDQQIAEISPDGNLVVTCFVNPADIGFIRKEQSVKIQVDALNYNEWGLLNASIFEISDDMIVGNESSAYFRIKCKPERSYLTLKNGIQADLKKGMSVNARIIVTRRSLFNLLFDKADRWLNPYIKRES